MPPVCPHCNKKQPAILWNYGALHNDVTEPVECYACHEYYSARAQITYVIEKYVGKI